MVPSMSGRFSWGGDLRDKRTAGPGAPDSGKRGKAKRRAASKRARVARRANR